MDVTSRDRTQVQSCVRFAAERDGEGLLRLDFERATHRLDASTLERAEDEDDWILWSEELSSQCRTRTGSANIRFDRGNGTRKCHLEDCLVQLATFATEVPLWRREIVSGGFRQNC